MRKSVQLPPREQTTPCRTLYPWKATCDCLNMAKASSNFQWLDSLLGAFPRLRGVTLFGSGVRTIRGWRGAGIKGEHHFVKPFAHRPKCCTACVEPWAVPISLSCTELVHRLVLRSCGRPGCWKSCGKGSSFALTLFSLSAVKGLNRTLL